MTCTYHISYQSGLTIGQLCSNSTALCRHQPRECLPAEFLQQRHWRWLWWYSTTVLDRQRGKQKATSGRRSTHQELWSGTSTGLDRLTQYVWFFLQVCDSQHLKVQNPLASPGHNYSRSLDLLAECLENAGGTVFCSGHLQPYSEITKWLADYQVNVICGDASHILQLAQHICSLPPDIRQSIKLTKIIYTSESLARSQRAYLESVFTGISIFSVLGSAETGAWAVVNMALTGKRMDDGADFIFDTRTMIVEVLQQSQDSANDKPGAGVSSSPCTDGSLGVIVLTSLQRLRNPLVRYVTGDLGSLHDLPLPAARVPKDLVPYLKVLRLHGRDQRFSFEWQAGYFEFQELQSAMQKAEYGILHWQIVLTSENEPPADRLELRILRIKETGKSLLSNPRFVEEMLHLFFVLPSNSHLFKLTHVTDAQGFERSRTGNKVIKFVDHRKMHV